MKNSRDKAPAAYRAWQGMKQKCLNRKHFLFPKFGAVGIKICDRWKDSFENFLEDMGERPDKFHHLSLTNKKGNYEPKNCRWVKGRANQVLVTKNGKSQCLKDYCKEAGLKYSTICKRRSKKKPINNF